MLCKKNQEDLGWQQIRYLRGSIHFSLLKTLLNQSTSTIKNSVLRRICLFPEEDPFFGIVSRDNVRILLKHITEYIHPAPNHTRHEWARWDAFILTSDPDALFAEYQSRGLAFHETLADTSDGLRAFELKDYDEYVLCFGKPL